VVAVPDKFNSKFDGMKLLLMFETTDLITVSVGLRELVIVQDLFSPAARLTEFVVCPSQTMDEV
jgi:hypothetical protein